MEREDRTVNRVCLGTLDVSDEVAVAEVSALVDRRLTFVWGNPAGLCSIDVRRLEAEEVMCRRRGQRLRGGVPTKRGGNSRKRIEAKVASFFFTSFY